MDLGSPKVEPGSSSKRQEGSSSLKIHRYQASVAMGSSTSLERSMEWNHDMGCKVHEKDREWERNCSKCRKHDHEVDHGHPREKDWHHDHSTGHDCSMAIKHGWSDEFGDPSEHRHSKEQ